MIRTIDERTKDFDTIHAEAEARMAKLDGRNAERPGKMRPSEKQPIKMPPVRRVAEA